MNSTIDPRYQGSENIGGLGYGIGVSVGILLLITTITLAAYYCTRSNTTDPVLPQTDPRSTTPPLPGDYAAEIGIGEAALTSFPKLLYSEVKASRKDSTAGCCSICLTDYKGSDILRVLPECGHRFHLKCVDPWLRRHPTCPICRTSPMPSPMSTPLAEVVPLATRPIGYYNI